MSNTDDPSLHSQASEEAMKLALQIRDVEDEMYADPNAPECDCYPSIGGYPGGTCDFCMDVLWRVASLLDRVSRERTRQALERVEAQGHDAAVAAWESGWAACKALHAEQVTALVDALKQCKRWLGIGWESKTMTPKGIAQHGARERTRGVVDRALVGARALLSGGESVASAEKEE